MPDSTHQCPTPQQDCTSEDFEPLGVHDLRPVPTNGTPWQSHPRGCSCWDCNPHPCSDCGEPIGGDPAIDMRCAACLMRAFKVWP